MSISRQIGWNDKEKLLYDIYNKFRRANGLAYKWTQGDFFQQGSKLNYFRWFNDYKSIVTADSGTVQSDAFSKSVYKIIEQNSMKTDLKLSVIAEGGLKTRDSGVEKFVTKAYDLFDTNTDAVQTTETSQFFLGGRIAPNEIQNFKSVTGETKSLTHSDIVVSGTYTIIKVGNAENSGKTIVSFTEVGSGTYNTITYTGRLYGYFIYGGTLSVAQKANFETSFLQLVNVIESVQIGTQTWATSNFEAVATPMGNVIQEMQAASSTEKIVNGGFDTNKGWALRGTWEISGGTANSNETIETVQNIFQYAGIVGRWYKVTFEITSVSQGGVRPIFGTSAGFVKTAIGTYTEYKKSTANALLGIQTQNYFIGSIDNVSFQELGWEDSQELYDELIAQGYSEANAVKECAMWCYYNNDPAIGAIYGKLYNWYAAKLLQNDIDAYNAANPTAHWGWHVPTQAEFITLQTALGGESVAGGKMKVPGLDYWNIPNTGATNESGFSTVGAGYRAESGSFIAIKNDSRKWTNTSNGITIAYMGIVNSSSSVLRILGKTESKLRGYSLRLIKE